MLLTLFLAVGSASVTLEDKEDFCYVMAARHVRGRSQEIDEYLEKNQNIGIPSIRAKLLEDTFYACVDEPGLDYYVEDMVLKYFDKYMDLVKVPLEKYKTMQDVKVSHEFSKNKPEYVKRAMMKPKSYKDF